MSTPPDDLTPWEMRELRKIADAGEDGVWVRYGAVRRGHLSLEGRGLVELAGGRATCTPEGHRTVESVALEDP